MNLWSIGLHGLTGYLSFKGKHNSLYLVKNDFCYQIDSKIFFYNTIVENYD